MTLMVPSARRASQQRSLSSNRSSKCLQRRGLGPTSHRSAHSIEPGIRSSALRGHTFFPDPELGPWDLGGLFLFMGRVSPLSAERRGPTDLTITQHSDLRSKAARRLGHTDTPKPTLFSTSIHLLTHRLRRFHAGFPLLFIDRVVPFSASTFVVDLYTSDLI